MKMKTRNAGRSAVALAAAALAGLLAFEPVAHACSRVLWAAPDGQVFVGRTQDWTERVNSSFRVHPRGTERVGAVARNPYRWTTKYGSVALSAYDSGTHEGVNEKGLAAHALYLAGPEVSFDTRDPKRPGIGVMQWVQYYLDNYATVAEAVAAQKNVAFQIEPLILPNGYPTLVHVSLSDKSGDSAVIEYIGGKARVYHDRRFNVMTNEPTYDKQIANLKQYRTFGGDKPLPGERTPTDRFVRAAYYANGLPKPASRGEGAAYMFSVIRNISVPFGTGDPEKPNIASTIFRTVIDLTGGRYYFESTYAPNVVWVDYSKLDFGKGTGERELQVEKKIYSLNGDVTAQLQPAKPFVFGRNEG
jgi:choloylglycine hydrolase